MSSTASKNAYSTFCRLYTEKKLEPALDEFLKIDLKYFLQNDEVIIFLFNTCSYIANKVEPSDSKYAFAIANGIQLYVEELARRNDHEKFFTILNLFTSRRKSEFKIIVDLERDDFNLASWLHIISVNLFKVLKNTAHWKLTDDDSRKKLYLNLSEALLLYVNAETMRSQKKLKLGEFIIYSFKETKYFLEKCMQLKCFEHSVYHEYVITIELIDDFISCFINQKDQCNNKDVYLMIDKCFKKLESFRQKGTLRATLLQDCYLTFSKIIKMCQPQLIGSLSEQMSNGFLECLQHLCYILTKVKSTKNFCVAKCESVMTHSLNDLYEISSKVLTESIERKWTNKSIDIFCCIAVQNFKMLGTIDCPISKTIQYDAWQCLMKVLSPGKTKERAQISVKIVKKFLQQCKSIDFHEDLKIDKVNLLLHLFSLSKDAEDWEQLTSAGYTLMALQVNKSKEAHIVSIIAKMQRDSEEHISIQTPHEFFDSKGARISEYSLCLPETFNPLDISLAYLQQCDTYGLIDCRSSNKIIHQILLPNKYFDPMKHLRFIYFVSNISIDRTSADHLNVHLKRLKADYIKEKNVVLGLLIGAIDHQLHQLNINAWNKENSNISAATEFSAEQLASSSSIFRRFNFEREREIIKSLRFIKRVFIDFINYFIEKSEEDRVEFAVEKNYLLNSVSRLSGEFLIRDYQSDGMELFISMYKLSKASGDEYGLIDTCSFFAENSVEFQQMNPLNESLESITNCCHEIVLKKLKDIEHISMRRKNQIFCFLLNLVSFYLEEKRTIEAKIILVYVFKTSNRINRKTLELTYGNIKTKSSPPVDRPIIDSNVIRIKFYSILFQLITKYGEPSVYPPLNFIRFSLLEIQQSLNMVSDPKYTIPIIVFKMIAEMVMWSQYRYETSDTMERLLRFTAKFAWQNGFLRRGADSIRYMMLVDLYAEKSEDCENKLTSLELVAQIDADSNLIECDSGKVPTTLCVDKHGQLTDPARYNVVSKSPKKCLSPNRTTGNNISSKLTHYLQDHSSGCKCSICMSSNQKYFLFEIACAYGRYVYLNSKDFNVAGKRAVFNDLYEYWDKNHKNYRLFPRNDRFYLNSARMLMWCAHFEWKYEKNYDRAKGFLIKALKGLEKAKRCDYAFERDLKAQIVCLNQYIENSCVPEECLWLSVNIMNSKKDFNATGVGVESSVRKNKLVMQPISLVPRINLFDMINPDAEPVKFEIHDDEGAAKCTPSIKKSTNVRRKLETPICTPSIRKKLTIPDSAQTTEKRNTRPRNISQNIESISSNEVLNNAFTENSEERTITEPVIPKIQPKRSTRKKA